MKCLIELWGSCAYIYTEEPDHGYAWLNFTFPRKAALNVDHKEIIAPDVEELAEFIRQLPKLSTDLKSYRRGKGKRALERRYGTTSIAFSGGVNIKGMIARFTTLFSNIAPSLELAESLYAQVKRRPPKMETSVRLIGHGEVDGLSIDEWLDSRKRAGRKIDPNTAEVCSHYAQTLDPYGVYGELPWLCQQVGKERFARAPGSDVWVSFSDLPTPTLRALYKRMEKEAESTKGDRGGRRNGRSLFGTPTPGTSTWR